MKVACSFSPDFIEGFVKKCQELGLNCEETESLFKKHANNSLIAHPRVYEGFAEKLAKYNGGMRKSALLRWMNPDMISLAEECRIKWGSDLLSQQMRARLGWPEPSWDTVPPAIKAAASDLSLSMHSFDHMPLNQKILLASLIGGGIGGAVRGMSPSADDQLMDRSALDRVTRGLGRGALSGAGAAVGAGAAGELTGAFGDVDRHGEEISNPLKTPAMLLGAGLGGVAGYRLGQ